MAGGMPAISLYQAAPGEGGSKSPVPMPRVKDPLELDDPYENLYTRAQQEGWRRAARTSRSASTTTAPKWTLVPGRLQSGSTTYPVGLLSWSLRFRALPVRDSTAWADPWVKSPYPAGAFLFRPE